MFSFSTSSGVKLTRRFRGLQNWCLSSAALRHLGLCPPRCQGCGFLCFVRGVSFSFACGEFLTLNSSYGQCPCCGPATALPKLLHWDLCAKLKTLSSVESFNVDSHRTCIGSGSRRSPQSAGRQLWCEFREDQEMWWFSFT